MKVLLTEKMKIKEIHGGNLGRCAVVVAPSDLTKREGKRQLFYQISIHNDFLVGFNDWMRIFSKRRVIFWPETGQINARHTNRGFITK